MSIAPRRQAPWWRRTWRGTRSGDEHRSTGTSPVVADMSQLGGGGTSRRAHWVGSTPWSRLCIASASGQSHRHQDQPRGPPIGESREPVHASRQISAPCYLVLRQRHEEASASTARVLPTTELASVQVCSRPDNAAPLSASPPRGLPASSGDRSLASQRGDQGQNVLSHEPKALSRDFDGQFPCCGRRFADAGG